MPLPKIHPDSSINRTFFLVLLIGIMMGMVIVTAIVFGLYALGYISPAGSGISMDYCPPTQAVPPTCIPVSTPIPHSMDTPEPIIVIVTATPDVGATATAACATFQEQFPATPCP